MIAVDSNILVYSFAAESQHHSKAREVLQQLAEAPAAWAIPWPCVHEFISIVTNPRIYRAPADFGAAVAEIDNWAESPGLTFISEAPGYLALLKAVAGEAGVTGGLIHDAKIAAICMQHGVSELLTADRDFSRFKGLRTLNPFLT